MCRLNITVQYCYFLCNLSLVQVALLYNKTQVTRQHGLVVGRCVYGNTYYELHALYSV